MNIKKHIPNTITCGNLLCGCLALVQTFEGHLIWASYLIGIAAVLDFFDGFAARMLNVSSPIGKDLDSLADMVTFGVVPGAMVFVFFRISIENYYELDLSTNWAYVAFLIPIFSAVRLAKFNHDTRQSDSFIGLPTPANAILIGSVPIISVYDDFNYVYHPYLLMALTCMLSFMLIAELPLFALKFKHFKWKENEIRFVFLVLSLALLVIFQFIGIPLVIILYILLSLLNNLFFKKKAV
jgi:CDP-diacylglycerol--serine O-phosphatidyltransferase